MSQNQLQSNAARDAGQIVEELVSKHDPAVKHRARIEAAICQRLIFDLQSKGYTLDVSGEESVDSTDNLLRLLFNLDEATLACHHDTLKDTFVFLVFGNDGYDLICDYGVSLETIIAPIYDWITEAQDNGIIPVL